MATLYLFEIWPARSPISRASAPRNLPRSPSTLTLTFSSSASVAASSVNTLLLEALRVKLGDHPAVADEHDLRDPELVTDRGDGVGNFLLVGDVALVHAHTGPSCRVWSSQALGCLPGPA